MKATLAEPEIVTRKGKPVGTARRAVRGRLGEATLPPHLDAFVPRVRDPALAQCFSPVYVHEMTQAVAQILGEVEQLSETERQELRRAIVERVPMSDDLTDDDFAALAAASFQALDEEEKTPRA